MDESSIGDLVRSRRTRLGLTQRELADRSGLSVRALGKIERGEVATVRSGSVSRLSAVLGFSAADLPKPSTGPAVSIGVLGRLVVRPVDVVAGKQRTLVALLALHAGTPVGRDEIVDVLWDDRPPASWPGLVHTYVARLRKVLPERAITVAPNGYRLDAKDIALDAAEFDRRVAGAHRLLSAGDVGAAEEELARALALWRGPVLADLPDRIRTSPSSAALSGRRLAAALTHADISRTLGRHDQAVASLRVLTDAEPLHEGLHARLMLALTGAGNQSAALVLFGRIRGRLAEELGVSPGAELRQAHQDVLRQEVLPPLLRTPIPRQLPPPPRWFTGRARELAAIDAAAAGGAVIISALAGAGGMGKTWLALRWAHDHAGRFPDGQLFVDLRGFAPHGRPLPSTVAVRGFLDALGVESSRVPQHPDAQVALYRSLIAEKRMVIVLDNAADTAQVVPLLPGTPTCTVLVTSRDRLPGLVASHGARPLSVDVLSEREALDLLTARLGVARLAAEVDAVGELVAWCGGIPLALSIVAGRAEEFPGEPLARLARHLRDAASRLGVLDEGDPAASLPAVMSWSYQALSPKLAEVFGLLGLAPGPDIGLPAAAGLTGLPVEEVADALRALRRVSLVDEHTPGRWRMHDLVGLYAADRAQVDLSQEGRDAALRRLVDFYVATAHSGDRLLESRRVPIEIDSSARGAIHRFDDRPAALEWFDAEYACLLSALRRATEMNWHQAVWRLAWTLTTFQYVRGHVDDNLDVWTVASDATKHLDEPHTHTQVHRHLGAACMRTGRHGDSVDHLRQALDLTRRTGDLLSEAHTRHALAAALALGEQYQLALDNADESIRLFRVLDVPKCEADALNAMGWYQCQSGELGLAQASCEQALALHHELGDRIGEAATLDSLGLIAHRSGQHTRAVGYYRDALMIFRDAQDAYEEADTSSRLAEAHFALGHLPLAREAWQCALDLYREQVRVAEIDRVQRRLADTASQLPA